MLQVQVRKVPHIVFVYIIKNNCSRNGHCLENGQYGQDTHDKYLTVVG